jgi:hypothetical protein
VRLVEYNYEEDSEFHFGKGGDAYLNSQIGAVKKIENIRSAVWRNR